MHPHDLARSLDDALRKEGIYGVRVDVSGHRVWLTGSVFSVEDKDRELEVATSMPGVSGVRAEIEIASDPSRTKGPIRWTSAASSHRGR